MEGTKDSNEWNVFSIMIPETYSSVTEGAATIKGMANEVRMVGSCP
jgi:hypothetical protein